MTAKPPIDRQREHQANERTFLAWIRTALAMIGIGLAIARFGLFLRQSQFLTHPESVTINTLGGSEILGLGFIGSGLALIVLALFNYSRVSRQIETSNYAPNPLMVWLTAGFVMSLGILSIPLLLLNRSPDPPKSSTIWHQESGRGRWVSQPLKELPLLQRKLNRRKR